MSIFLELTKRQTRRVFQNPSGLSFFPLSPSTCLLTSASYPLVPVWRNLRCIQCNVVHIIHHMHQASYISCNESFVNLTTRSKCVMICTRL